MPTGYGSNSRRAYSKRQSWSCRTKTSFSVVCDASDYAIGCALLQKDDEGRERVISFQSRQLKAAERNYPVHDKELLAMKYALVKFRRMARWLSFFAEYNFRYEYKPGKLNVLADPLSRRPDYELAHVSLVTTDLYDRIRLAYQGDENYTPLVQFLSDGKDAKVDRLTPRQRAQLHRYELADGLLHYRVDPGDPPRVVVPNDEDLKYDILLEAHDAPISSHLDREKTYRAVSQIFWWPHMYKWMAHYVKTCETCQRVKPSGHSSAPLQSLPVPADCWKSKSLDFVFGLPTDDKGNTKGFWDALFHLLETKLTMSTAGHPRTDGQTERANRVLEDTLRASVLRHLGPVYTQQCRTRINGVYPVLFEWITTPLGAANLAGRHRGLHRNNKLKHRFIGPVGVLGRHGAAYTIDLVKSMATHPTSYVGRLKRIFSLRGQKKIKSGRAPLFKSRLSLANNANRSCQSLQNGMQAGTHAAHKKSTLGSHGMSSVKSYTHKPSGKNTTAAHKRARDRLTGKSIKATTESH
ncbi:Reverse transcriptase [Phytophthora palmivora]|uniref:Reverse transcriptase n=1 Tax=Phytophthora palmivora TaxID=4796 RepID=A0A2P4XL34_9STRA|nr:Reverse transcriptase [Phytophthora palmivora]